MIIFNANLKYSSDTSTLSLPDEKITDAKINELLNDVDFYMLMQYQNEPSNEEE